MARTRLTGIDRGWIAVVAVFRHERTATCGGVTNPYRAKIGRCTLYGLRHACVSGGITRDRLAQIATTTVRIPQAAAGERYTHTLSLGVALVAACAHVPVVAAVPDQGLVAAAGRRVAAVCGAGVSVVAVDGPGIGAIASLGARIPYPYMNRAFIAIITELFACELAFADNVAMSQVIGESLRADSDRVVIERVVRWPMTDLHFVLGRGRRAWEEKCQRHGRDDHPHGPPRSRVPR